MADGPAGRSEFAPAKVNLTLRIGRKRPDGYHDLESLVVFADTGDEVRLVPAATPALTVAGETASETGSLENNLVLKATRALAAHVPDLRGGHFHLTKRLPVAAGLGGGSSDAAAALRLLARLNNLSLKDPRLLAAAHATGADVPVCIDPQPRIMRGVGEILSGPLQLPPLHAVLVNPRIPVPTAQVFATLAAMRGSAGAGPIHDDPASRVVENGDRVSADVVIDAIAASANDLEAPAISSFPAVGETLAALRALAPCLLARMSGSGGTCFGLFATADDAKEAAASLARDYQGWWVRHATLASASARPVQ